MHRDVFPVACSGIRCQFHLISDSQSHFIVWSREGEGEGEERKKEKEEGVKLRMLVVYPRRQE